MAKKHTVIVVPGLGDNITFLHPAIYHWRLFGLSPIEYSFGFSDLSSSFEQKFANLLSLIDEKIQQGDRVSLVGTSAGASVVFNAFSKRKKNIHRVVNVCGRLRQGKEKGFRSFEKRTSSSPSFAESIIRVEEVIEKLTAKEKKKILTMRPMFGDELVPSDTLTIKGATNIQIPTIEHVATIGFGVTLFSNKIISFLQKEN